LTNQAEAREQQQKADNAKKSKEAADEYFSGEKWEKVEDGIYLSPNRKIGENSGYKDELRDAQILRDMGSTVYLVPEPRGTPGKKYDAIVNGERMEFKNIGGNENTLITHFLKSRSQAPNVFLNLETSDLTRRQIMSTLYGARNSITHADRKGNIIKGYADSNAFSGGRIILKIKGHRRLVYLNVDDLKVPKK
jgi:hypothetical protein